MAAQRVVDAEARVEASAGRLRTAEGSVREALRSLTSVAAGHGLPTDPDDLDRVEEELLHLERTVHTWAKRGHELAGAELRLSDRVAAHAEATELLAAAEESSERSRRQAQDAKVRLATLEATAGVEHKAVLAELEQLQDEARTKKRERQDLEELRRSLVRQIGVLTATVEQAEQDRIEAGEHRDAAHLRFLALAGDGGLEEAEVGRHGPLDGVTAVLAAARAVAVELEDGGDNTATQRASSHVDDALHAARSAVSGQADLSRDLGEHDWWVLRASVNGFRQSVLALHRKLQADLTEGQADLAAEEERLFEQTLAGSIRRSLANRIRQANRLVAGINEQLAVVRTAAAWVAVRLDWEQTRSGFEEREVDEQTCAVTSGDAAAFCTFPTKKGGSYRIKAVVVDEAGRKSQTITRLWVMDRDTPPDRGLGQDKVQLLLDKKAYAGGDTAELLVLSPFAPAEGMLVVARQGILSTSRFTMAAGM